MSEMVPSENLGPFDYFAVEFPDGQITADGFERLIELVDRGVIYVVSVDFVVKDPDGTARMVPVVDVPVPAGIDLSTWDGASSGILDDSDIATIAAAMAAGSTAVVVVYENLWVLGTLDGWLSQGARLIADSGLDTADLLAALEITED